MNSLVTIRRETEADYRQVEEINRKAFWNLYAPGCDEHYLAHILPSSPDFVPELALVAELDGRIIGSILYTKARLVDEAGEVKPILTFGPVCVVPELQRQGYGKLLMEASFEKAIALGAEVIVIFGNPGNYVSRGFISCKKRNVCLEGGVFPAAMMVKELKPGTLDGRLWVYVQTPSFTFDPKDAEQFDAGFEPLEKKVLPSQEEFYIHSHAILP